MQKATQTGLAVLALVLAVGGGLLWHSRHAATASGASIAVLPFANASDDKADAYVADGVQDEIRNRLSKVGGVRVIAGSSTQAIAGHAGSPQDVARQLGVASVLEGGVLRSGDAVHISLQLVRAQDGQRLWSGNYDTRLDQLSGVQGEIAGAIADQLGASLTGDARGQVVDAATRNAAAEDAWLHGLSLLHPGDPTQEAAAVHALEDAVKADPQFAVAWARLARVDSDLVSTGVDATPARRAAAQHALETAEHLQPGALETQAARAWYTYQVQGGNDEVTRQFAALHARWPNDVDGLLALSRVLGRQGRQAEADPLLAQALTLDPLDAQAHKQSAINFRQERQFDASIAQLHAAQALAPGDLEARSMEVDAALASGDLARAAVLLGPPPATIPDETARPGYFELERLQHRYADSIARLQRMLATPDPKAGPLDTFGVREELADMQRLSGNAASAQGNYRQLLATLQEVHKQQGDGVGLLQVIAWTEAGLGDAPAALAQVDKVVAATPEAKDAIVGRSSLELRARVLARLGRTRDAIAGLRYLLGVPYDGSAFSTYPVTPAILKLDPDFDGLRGDPEFQKLLQGSKSATPAH